jgi:beta-galactosidase/beta-glucuronidase
VTETSYPRPQFERTAWMSLDGTWTYAFDESERVEDVVWAGDIAVPFPPESQLSGVGDRSYHPVVWYRRRFTLPDGWSQGEMRLHFGAVDYRARVWVNGHLVASHQGGHTPFHADIAAQLVEGEQELIVRAEDDPHDMRQPRGKQEWQTEPHGIWYPRTSGIWQSVWLEPLPETRIADVTFRSDLTTFAVGCDVRLEGPLDGHAVEVVLRRGDERLADDRWQLLGDRTGRTIPLGVNGFDDLLDYLWSPEYPNLLDVDLRLLDRDGVVVDEVRSYTALRTVEARDGRFWLNGHPLFLRLALDQGYWDDGLLSPPNDDALRQDVELAKAMGFNGVRKHQKIEHPRYLYWADRLGLMVWEEMPSAYHFGSDTLERLTGEWLEAIARDRNHPCVVAWVCFNESWGTPDLVHDPRQRDAVAALYHLTRALDGSRPVIGNDGWEHVESDLLTVHDYSRDPATLAQRYGTPEASRATSALTLEHGRRLQLDDSDVADRPIVLSEFGGIRYNPEAPGWGYQEADSPEALLATYAAMIAALSAGGLAGFCYTQFADTFQEQNGLLFSDRRPKIALEDLERATRGRR